MAGLMGVPVVTPVTTHWLRHRPDASVAPLHATSVGNPVNIRGMCAFIRSEWVACGEVL
jgi:hypothetical protein